MQLDPHIDAGANVEPLTVVLAPAPSLLEAASALPEKHATSGTGNRLISGSIWTVAGYATGQVLRLAGNVLVSRLLLPESFGLMALVNVFLQGLIMFSDVGIEPSIIQHRRGDEPTFRNTAWTLQILRGWLLFIVAVLLAWPVSFFYDEPRLLAILPVAAIGAIISGHNSTALFTVRRHLQLGRLTLLDLTGQSIGLLVMCSWAWFYPSVWALAGGSLAAAAVTALGSHWLIAGPRNRCEWEWEAFHELFHFGKWIFLSTLILFCAGQTDRLLLGKLIPLDQLGVYSVALAVAMLPNLLLGMLAGAVLYPLLARHARESSMSLLHPLRVARSVLLHVGWSLSLGAMIMAPRFFAWLYDSRYHDAGMIAQLLSIAVWIMVLSTTAERALPAIGDPRGLATFNLVRLIATVPATLLGFHLYGLPGFIVGIAVGSAVAHAALLWRLQRHGLSLMRQDTGFTVSLIVATLATYELGRLTADSVLGGDLLLLGPIVAIMAWRTWQALRGLSQFSTTAAAA